MESAGVLQGALVLVSHVSFEVELSSLPLCSGDPRLLPPTSYLSCSCDVVAEAVVAMAALDNVLATVLALFLTLCRLPVCSLLATRGEAGWLVVSMDAAVVLVTEAEVYGREPRISPSSKTDGNELIKYNNLIMVSIDYYMNSDITHKTIAGNITSLSDLYIIYDLYFGNLHNTLIMY